MKIAVIGAGASGMAAAVSAHRTNADAEIVIVERMDRIGKKLLATGNGCCNFSNVNTSQSNFHGRDTSFVNYALNEFTVGFTVNFFNSLGVFAKQKDGGKLYPFSERASAVLDALRTELEHCGITVKTGFDTASVSKNGKGFKLISKKNDIMLCDRLIVAGGGCASPALGSDGSCFELTKKLGHKVTPLQPALVQLKTNPALVKSLKGIKVMGSAAVFMGGKCLGEEYGEILFTDYGLSGPPVFQLSAIVPFKSNMDMVIDFMPDYSPKDVFDILYQRCLNLSHLTMESYFNGLLNKRIGNIIARQAGIEKLSMSVAALDKKRLWTIASLIKGFKLPITGTKGFNNAQVTAGGLVTDMFNSRTMESRIINGLYCCGEIFDIYGDCGGYNLQWAWSSGFLAGRSAAVKS